MWERLLTHSHSLLQITLVAEWKELGSKTETLGRGESQQEVIV